MPLVKQTATEETVITATLKRGRNYVYHHVQNGVGRYHEFKRGVPEIVSPTIADELEALVDVIRTEDDDEIEKSIFEVDREAPTRLVKPLPKRKRLRIVTVDDDEEEDKPLPKAGVRTGPIGLKARTGR